MANFKEYLDGFLIEWEGAVYENVPGDSGGPTKYGITLEDWQHYGHDKDGNKIVNAADVALIDYNDASILIKAKYWDVFKADDIHSQSIAESIVDFGYNCGVGIGKKIQTILEIPNPDGVFGPITVGKINAHPNSQELFTKIKNRRIDYYMSIVNNKPSQQKFLKGWLNRVNALKYKS